MDKDSWALEYVEDVITEYDYKVTMYNLSQERFEFGSRNLRPYFLGDRMRLQDEELTDAWNSMCYNPTSSRQTY